MEMRTLGEDGPSVSVVGLGCNNFGMKIGVKEAAEVVSAALDEGINHFDTAENYGGGNSEEFLAAALGTHRTEVIIATKFDARPKGEPYEPGALARRIREGCEASLRRLKTDRIDLYYQHFPDAEAPIDEALETLHALVLQGKVLHLASSKVNAPQIEKAAKAAADHGITHFCGTLMEWNLLNRTVEGEVVPAARRVGLGIVPYFPLASGMLTGKYRRGEAFPRGSRFDAVADLAKLDARVSNFMKDATDENYTRVEALTELAQARGYTLLELAIEWLAAQDGVASVITGATNGAQIRANAKAVGKPLSTDDLAAVDLICGRTSRARVAPTSR
jgi:aryl-alcohol dehydrogenase-like predicted oxidoreductase